MAEDRLTVAVLGLNKNGRELLEAAHASGCFEIKAVADQDQQRAAKTADEFHCESHIDYRQLIVQHTLDCLLVAADTHLCDEHLKTAIKKKFNILKLPPAARDFEEALEYARLAEIEGVRFAIANPARFRSSYRTARDLLAQEKVKHPFLVTAECCVSGTDRPAWLTDPKLAGGGVLLHNSHQMVDQILWNFPIPQQVYALTTNQAPDKQQRLYLTEDTALVSMKFNDALMGHVIAAQRGDIGQSTSTLRIHGKDAIVTVTDDRVVLQRSAEPEAQSWQYADESQQDVLVALVSDFAQSVRSPADHKLSSSVAENLTNMAVFESAYLSARTGFPEEPARILRIVRNPSGTATSI